MTHKRNSRRAIALDKAVAVLAIAVALGYAGYTLFTHLRTPVQAGEEVQTPLPSTWNLTPEQALEQLLNAIDRRDYAGVEAFAKALFQNRDDVDIRPVIEGLRDPVIRAARDGDVQLFEALAVAKPAFGGRDELGRRPLHIAAEFDHAEVIEWLISNAAADPNDRLPDTRLSPLHIAAAANATRAIRALIDAEADVRASSRRGRTPLHHAVSREASVGVRALLEKLTPGQIVVLIDAPDGDGNSALHIAAAEGDAQIASMLLRAGASPTKTDALGRTPTEVAEANSHQAVVKVIAGD